MKTNAMRILDSQGIGYEVLRFDYDAQQFDAMDVARQVNMDPQQVCKTIVTITDDRRIIIFCIPSPYDISLKKAKQLVHAKTVELVEQKRLRTLTGYVRGGVSPVGMIHTYPTFAEETIRLFPTITISGGQRGILLSIAPENLLKVTSGEWADLV